MPNASQPETKQVEIVWSETNRYRGVFTVPADFDPDSEDQVDGLISDPDKDYWDQCLDRDVKKVRMLP